MEIWVRKASAASCPATFLKLPTTLASRCRICNAIVARQKSAFKRKKRAFRVSILLTLLSFIISTIILYILLAPISDNKTPRKEFYLFIKKFIIII